MHLDHELGSIESGKPADFTVLEEHPLNVDPMEIRDIGVWGTVVGGRPFEAARPSRTNHPEAALTASRHHADCHDADQWRTQGSADHSTA